MKRNMLIKVQIHYNNLVLKFSNREPKVHILVLNLVYIFYYFTPTTMLTQSPNCQRLQGLHVSEVNDYADSISA